MFVASAETATGVILLAHPPVVVRLLFAAEIAGAGAIMSRLAGIALIGLGVACWPGTPLIGMLTYGALAALYLACLGIAGGSAGVLLWPAVVVHVIVTALLARTFHAGKGMKNQVTTKPRLARNDAAARRVRRPSWVSSGSAAGSGLRRRVARHPACQGTGVRYTGQTPGPRGKARKKELGAPYWRNAARKM